MKNATTLLLFFTTLVLVSCSSSEDGGDSGGSTITQEIQPAKSFYSNAGATFKFRLYNYPPTEGDNNNNNNHMAEVHKIIDNNGQISVIGRYTVPAIFLQTSGAVLNVNSEIVSPQSSNAVSIQNTNVFDDFEMLDNTRLISYNSTAGAHGLYGFTGARVYVYNPVFFSGAVSSSANQGYMHTLNDSNFMLSMGLNSNYGKPMFYQYIPATSSWNGTVVPAMDYVQGSGINIPTTNDASKAGNSDKVFWAWLSYTTTTDNGKINIISYNGSSFSNVTSLDGIGSIGTTFSMAYKHTITLYENPNNLNNPYLVVRRYNTDILDIYKFTGSSIEVVKTGVTIPTAIPIISGTTRTFKELKFTGNNVYLITGMDKNLYKLSGSTFVVDRPDLTLEGERITAIEGTSNGLLMSVVKTLNTAPQPKTVSDVILIPNN